MVLVAILPPLKFRFSEKAIKIKSVQSKTNWKIALNYVAFLEKNNFGFQFFTLGTDDSF